MSQISQWILSIVALVMVGVVVEIILPQGKTNKLLKSIVAIFTVLILVLPIKNINLKAIDFSNIFQKFEIDQDFVDLRNKDMIVATQLEVQNNLSDNGYKNVTIKIEGSFDNENLLIKYIFVDLKNLVLSDENLNINKYTNIVAIIKKSIECKEESIIFYE